MNKNFDDFINSLNSSNTAKVVRSLQKIGDYDYSNCTPVDLEQIILEMKPNSPKAITTIVYVLSLYAKFMENENLYHMVQDIDRNAVWLIAKPNAPKKFISHSDFESVYHDVGVYEEHNSFYQQTLFRCLYEGIYSDDMSVVKNLKASDVKEGLVTLHDDSGKSYDLAVSEKLSSDLNKLGSIDVWERNNRYGVCKITTQGLYKDSCFKVENRKGSKEYSYRYSYYRMLRKISKEYVGYNLLPLQIYVSGIMYRIGLELKSVGITIEEAFSNKNKDRTVNRIISNELVRCNCDTEVKNFREMVKGHLDVFCN